MTGYVGPGVHPCLSLELLMFFPIIGVFGGNPGVRFGGDMIDKVDRPTEVFKLESL